jgi:predicted ArsR family transcriptional regulator
MSEWTFITNHGAVLILISRHGEITARAISDELGITERSVYRIINDLETEGYISKHRVGRANHYQVNRDVTLRREALRDIAVGELLKVLMPEI